MKNKCTFCGKEYEAKRASSLYCSPYCKLKANRQKTVSVSSKEVSVSVTVSKKPLSVSKPVSVSLLKKEEVDDIPVTTYGSTKLLSRPDLSSKSGKPPFDTCPKHDTFYSSCHC